MLNSVKHEILNAHKYKNIKKFGVILGSDQPRMLFLPLISVKMPTIVGILTFMSRKKFMAWENIVIRNTKFPDKKIILLIHFEVGNLSLTCMTARNSHQ